MKPPLKFGTVPWTYTENALRQPSTKPNQIFLTKLNDSHVFPGPTQRMHSGNPYKHKPNIPFQTKPFTRVPGPTQRMNSGNLYKPNQIILSKPNHAHVFPGPTQKMHSGNLHKTKPNISYQTKSFTHVLWTCTATVLRQPQQNKTKYCIPY